MDDFINPPEFMEAQQKRLDDEKQPAPQKFPERPERDVLLFLLEHAPLERWQRDVLSIIRDEAYYFAPQGQTKIMNEGWASYWHSTIMTEQGPRRRRGRRLRRPPLRHDGHAARASSIRTSSGIELFRDIEDRWNRGRFGKEYDECDDFAARRQLGQARPASGREKIFEVRRTTTT